MKFRLQHDLLLIDVITVLLFLIAAFVPLTVVRIILGLPMVLFFPGYMLTTALFPRRDALGDIERVALSFGLSIVAVPLIGLILNYTPSGIAIYPVLISLTVFILAASLLAWDRRRKIAQVERFIPSFYLAIPWREQNITVKILSIVLIAVILGAIGTFGYVMAKPKYNEKFTEFYILGAAGTVTDYPTELKVGEPEKVILGIVNKEYETVSYQVVIQIEGAFYDKIGPIELEADEKWEQLLSFTPNRAGDNQKVEFLLFKNGEDQPYRQTRLQVNVK